MSTLNVGSINSGPIGGMRNALINGNPTINQRGYVSGAATSGANQYTLDRWRVVVSGESLSWTDSENTRTVTAPAGGVEQVVEGINLISGSYVLSWTGTATATIDGNSVSSGSPVTLTGGTNATVRFSNGTFALAQLEPGTRATPFERRSYGQELALCQRYYYKLQATGGDNIFGNGYNVSTTISRMIVNFPVTMRTAPTALEQTGTASDYRVLSTGGASTTCSAVPTMNFASPWNAGVVLTVAAGLTDGHGSYARSNSASAYLAYTAEL